MLEFSVNQAKQHCQHDYNFQILPKFKQFTGQETELHIFLIKSQPIIISFHFNCNRDSRIETFKSPPMSSRVRLKTIINVFEYLNHALCMHFTFYI